MKKLFRLANAEFNKIFYRPSMFILTALLIIALVLSNLAYKPVPKTTELSYEANKVGEIYNMFIGTEATINKNTIDTAFSDTKKKVVTDYDSITKDNKLKNLKDLILVVDTDITDNIPEESLRISGLTIGKFNSEKSSIIDTYNGFKQNAQAVLNYMATIKSQTLNFFMTKDQYDTIYNNVQRYFDTFPNSYEEANNKEYFTALSNTLSQDFKVDDAKQIISEMQDEIIKIDDKEFNNLIKTYYDDALAKLQIYFKEIDDFYNENYDSKDEDDLAEINSYIAKYHSYSTMNKTVLSDSFTLLRVNDKSDTELPNYIGYGDISKYHLAEEISINKYMIEKEVFDYNYLTSFNYNKSSGATINAYDYTVYSMQILSLFIIVFTIYYACSSIAGDQSSGTMKMIAIRPYTRNKLYAGKFVSCVMFGGLLMLIALVASFVVGVASYGFTTSSCLIVFNSSNVFELNPLILLACYFASLMINLLFYVSLAMFISVICRSNTLSVILTTIIYGVQVVLSGVINKEWLKYTPFGHFDLFKYFGNSEPGLLSLNILPDADFYTSLIVIGCGIVIMNAISHLIFQKRDIS